MSEENGARPIAVANAPVSYGAFELTVGHDPNVPDGTTVLDQVAAAGYAGIDLGPVGYLGSNERLGELLAERGLGLAGAYVELPYADPDALERALPELDAILATFEIEGGTGGTGRSWRTEEITGYESGFKNELVAFHDSIVTGRPAPTSGLDGLRDVALCQAIIDSHHRSVPVDYPTEVGAGEVRK